MLRTKPSDPLWWTPECTAAEGAKKQAWQHYQNRRTSPGRHATYKQTAKASTVQLQTAKRQDALRIKKTLREGSVKNKQWWPLLKRAGGQGRNSSVPTIQDPSSVECVTSSEKAKCFGKFFCIKMQPWRP